VWYDTEQYTLTLKFQAERRSFVGHHFPFFSSFWSFLGQSDFKPELQHTAEVLLRPSVNVLLRPKNDDTVIGDLPNTWRVRVCGSIEELYGEQ